MAKLFNGLLVRNLKSFVLHSCSTHSPIFPDHIVSILKLHAGQEATE